MIMKIVILKVVKKCVQAGIVLACTLCVLCGLFLLSGQIPKESIRENLLASAKIMEEQGNKYELSEGKDWTRMDNYADAAWLNILYSLDPDRLWQTMLESPLYVDFGGQEESLTHALTMRVEQDLAANTVYDRYWHGTILLLRPMLVFFQMSQIYTLIGCVFAVLFLILCVLLWRRKMIYAAVILAIAIPVCGMQYMPFCAEYWSPWLIALLLMIYVLIRRPGLWEGSLLMLMSGTAAAYFDFLTTETVTFGLPYLILLLLWEQKFSQMTKGKYLLSMIQAGCLWVAGYGAAMLIKWVGSSLLLGQNRISFALTKAVYWEGGNSGEIISRSEGILANVRMLLPFRNIGDDLNLILALMAVILLLFSFVFLFRREKAPAIGPALLLTACIPALRILVMSLHSGYHYFFTYRALYLTVSAAGIYIVKKVDWKMVRKKFVHNS